MGRNIQVCRADLGDRSRYRHIEWQGAPRETRRQARGSLILAGGLQKVHSAGDSEGWAFGRAVTDGELRAVVHAVPNVRRISLLRIYEIDPGGDGLPRAAGATIVIGPDELVFSGTHAVSCSRD